MATETPLLTSVAVVCASHEAIAPLEHVARLIDAFLDPRTRFSSAEAAATGSVRLLERVLVLLDGLDRFLLELRLREAMQEAVERGHKTVLELLHSRHPGYLAANTLALAAARGNLELIQWLLLHRPQHRSEEIPAALTAAAKHGQLSTLRYFLEDRGYVFCPSGALRAAIEHGHIDAIQYLYTRGVRCDMRAVGNIAAKSGHLSVVQWLHRINAPLTFTSEAMTAAAGAGHLEIVRFLHENRSEGCRSRAMDGAATRGRIDILDFLYANRHEGYTERAMVGAAHNGHIDVLHWLFQHSPRFVNRTVAAPAVAALANGHDDVLVWLETTVGPIPKLPAYAAVEIAKAGNLEGIQALHELHGSEIQWSPRVADVAATDGNVAMLQWLHDNRMQTLPPTAIDLAAKNGELQTVQWLHAHGVECTASTLASAVVSGQLPIVQWVGDRYAGWEASAAMDIAATLGKLPIVQWLHANRSTGCTTTAMDQAAMNGHLEVVIWLHENRSEGCTISALDNAATMGHWEVAQWLVHNRTESCTALAMDDAVALCHIRIAELLHHHYGVIPSENAVMAATKSGFLAVLQWLHARELLVDTEACRLRAQRTCQFHIGHWIDSLNASNQ